MVTKIYALRNCLLWKLGFPTNILDSPRDLRHVHGMEETSSSVDKRATAQSLSLSKDG